MGGRRCRDTSSALELSSPWGSRLPHGVRRRQIMRARTEPLEPRRLLALPPALFAEASDSYTLTIDPVVPATLLTSVRWGVELVPGAQRAQADDFVVTLPAGTASPALFQLAATQLGQPLIRIDQLTSTGRLRARWDLLAGSGTSKAYVKGYAQFTGGDGILYDRVTLGMARVINSFYVPNPAGGADVEARADFNFLTLAGTIPPLQATQYMSTAPDVRSTIEFGFGQLPLSDYQFEIVTPPAPDPPFARASFTAVASPDALPLWGRVGNGQVIQNAVHAHRDAQARPLARTRFNSFNMLDYELFDTMQDALPRTESYRMQPDRVQSIAYTYDPATGAMNAPLATGWSFVGGSYNPAPVTAFIRPPTFGSRPAPVESVNIQFTHAVTNLTVNHFRFENLSAAGLTLSTSDGGLSWTLGNLAPQQTADGDYAVKLFVLGSGLTGAPVGSTGIKWTLDTVAPSVTTSNFEFLTRHALHVTLSENVAASISPADLELRNLTNNTTIPPGATALVYDAQSNTATFTFPGLAQGLLPDGSYR